MWLVVSVLGSAGLTNPSKILAASPGNSLAVQWLGLHAFTAKGPGSIPGWGTKIPQALQSKKPPKNKKPPTLSQSKS